jgi:hypothetical protein
LIFGSGSSYTERARIDASGNFGLGVTPSAWKSGAKAFQLGTTGYASLNEQANGSTSLNFNCYESAANTWTYYVTGVAPTRYTQLSGAHAWFTAPSGTAGNPITFTQAMTLDASGNLLVGTTTTSGITNGASANPHNFLSFEGNVNAQRNNGSCFYASKATGYTNSSFHEFYVNGSGVGTISYNGTLTVYSTTSDYRLKTVVGPVAGYSERIDALEPVEYTWNANGKKDRGFLAHKFQEVYPSSVTGSKDEVDADGNPVYQQMQGSTNEVIADLVAELKSIRIRLTALEAK